ncbi:MAG: hypothetical protein WCC60_19880 [Ilumatobacteraceae bacterium]
MKRLLAALVAIGASLLPCSVEAGGTSDDPIALPPVHVPGARTVYTASPDGVIEHLTTIPGASAFARHGGRNQPCTFTAGSNGTTHNGTPFATGQQVISDQWLFQEVPMTTGYTDEYHSAVGAGPLSAATRYFFVFCDTTSHPVGFVIVQPNDALFNPHDRLTSLYNTLHLQRPVIYRNPVVDIWGGLVTRYPTWLAINPAAWTDTTSNTEQWHGWNLHLTATPTALQFQVTFTPDPEQPSPPFNGIVPCIASGAAPTADTVALPAMPELPEQTEPGTNQPCMWTPPGPGTVTIQARLDYHVTLWANGYTEPQPDYTWTGDTTTFIAGELNIVNTNT